MNAELLVSIVRYYLVDIRHASCVLAVRHGRAIVANRITRATETSTVSSRSGQGSAAPIAYT